MLKETTPTHYNMNGIDPISIMPELFKLNGITDPTEGFLLGNAIKYIWRIGAKGNRNENIDKAIDYLERLKTEEQPAQQQTINLKPKINPHQQ